jgi:ornithine carbamoyltransferase
MLDEALARKQARRGLGMAEPDADRPLDGRLLALVFIQPSTRTRVSFDVGMRQLGGQTIVLNGDELQVERGESMADTARVLSRYVDAIMVRTRAHEMLEELVQHASVPVINGLTDRNHPCQLMADVLTFEEHRGPIGGRVIAWSGDGNNVATSWIHGAAQFGYELRLACPEALNPSPQALAWAAEHGARVSVTSDPEAAVEGADCVVSDAWVSMHDDPASDRHNLLAPYQVNERQKAILSWCLG